MTRRKKAANDTVAGALTDLSCSPTVQRNTPPKPTSSPNMTAVLSVVSAVSRALLIDWNRFRRVVSPETGVRGVLGC